MEAKTLLGLNVNEHTEKKGGLTYLSWAWAWAEALKADPHARYEVRTFGPADSRTPVCYIGETALVCVEVVMFAMCRECWLPVMDNRNKAIKNPDSFAVNTSIMRCMTKALSLFGLGLYIYAGEDLPQVDGDEPDQRKPPAQPQKQPLSDERFTKALAAIIAGTTSAELIVQRFALTEAQELALDAARGSA